MLITGDFKFPIIKWNSNKIVGGRRDEQEQVRLLLDLTDKFFLQQKINKPTRMNNTLDLLFTNTHDLIHGHCVEKKTIFSDHSVITVTTKRRKGNNSQQGISPEQQGFKAFNFNSENVNWGEIKLQDV